MKATRILICLMAVAAMLFTSCGKDDGGNGGNGGNGGGGGGGDDTTNVLAETTWQYYNENDPDFHGAVTYTVEIGSDYDISFTREIVYPGSDATVTVMSGTYTYGDNGGVALVCYPDDPTEYRMTFTVSGDEMVWHYGTKDVTLTKQ